MRKRYSRSYTVLSFLTMFSYRELPSRSLLLIGGNHMENSLDSEPCYLSLAAEEILG